MITDIEIKKISKIVGAQMSEVFDGYVVLGFVAGRETAEPLLIANDLGQPMIRMALERALSLGLCLPRKE